MMNSPYHPGERAVQSRAGVIDRADHVGRGVRTTVPTVAAAFLEQRRMLVVGATDTAGRVWASLLTGPPGFVRATDDRTVVVVARPHPGDPLAAVLWAPAPAQAAPEVPQAPVEIGAIAIEPATRRRMRINGTARPYGPEPQGEGLLIHTEQVYSNCPKYIQKRELHAAGLPRPDADRPPLRGTALTPNQQDRVRTADTFFVATAGERDAADASHRGGNPGFVQVLAANRLCWPDYPGNAMFMTLGNIEANPAAGLLFPDWSTGGVLMLSGTARVEWDADGERRVDFTLAEVVELFGVSGLGWSDPEFSPANPPVTNPPVTGSPLTGPPAA